jgi:ribonuclease HIII
VVARKHISWKTKYASALLALRHIPYDDAKQMTEDQIISLYQVDHNILYESLNPDRDKYWNLTPTLIKEHREKTKADAKVIAKGKRLREKHRAPREHATITLAELERQMKTVAHVRKLISRGFDKTLRKKMNGKVERR